MNGWMALAMGHYSHVLGSGTMSARAPRRLRLRDVSVMAMRAEAVTLAFWRAVIAECLASLLLVLFGCLATLTCPGPRDANAHTLLVALCFGLTVGSLVQSFQAISGAHLNPVVSLVQLLTCKVTPLRALLYVLAQTGGAVAGASILHGITTGSCQADLGVTVLQQGLSVWQGLGMEVLLTFLLLFTLCATNDPNRPEAMTTTHRAIAVGVAVTGCHLAGYRLTGSSMNPARSLGPAFVAGNWNHQWIYWAGPTLGGVAAGLLYEFIFDPSRTRSRSRPCTSVDAEDAGMATTSLTTVYPSHLPSSLTPPPSTSTLPDPQRCYYSNNNTPTLPLHNNLYHSHSGPPPPSPTLLGSPCPLRRDLPHPSPCATSNSATLNNISNNANNVTGYSSTLHKNAGGGGLAFSPTPTLSPQHSVPGCCGDRSLVDSRNNDLTGGPPSSALPHAHTPTTNTNSHHHSNNPHYNKEDLFTQAPPPVSRRSDVRAVTYVPPPPPQRRHGAAPAGEELSPGRENQAYTFDSHPRRLHPVSPASSPAPLPTVLNLFDDGRENICLSDVRVL